MTTLVAGPAEQLEAVIGQFVGHLPPSLEAVADALVDDTAALRAPGELRRVLMALPIEASAFRSQYPMFTGGRTQLLSLLRRWFATNDRSGLEEREQLVVGTIGVLIMTLHGLVVSEHLLEGEGRSEHQSGSSATCCAAVVESPSAKEALILVYGDEGGDPATEKQWSDTTGKTWHFHRHGSTSVLVRAVGESGSEVRALKLVLPPYLRVREIRDATRLYKARYQIPPSRSQPESWVHLVDVYACTEQWILMSYVHGPPLSEHLSTAVRSERSAPPTPRPLGMRERIKNLTTSDKTMTATSARGLSDFIRLTEMRTVGLGLFAALLENREVTRRARDRPIAHGDLTPSNVIVAEGGTYVLIDHGPNYLYTRTAGAGASSEAVFIAPEVRRNEANTDVADLYSLAQIVILAGGLRPHPAGLVPDELYMWHPAVARLLEDYLDDQPRRRLSFLGDQSNSLTIDRLERLRAQFAFELDMAIAYQQDPGVVASRWPQMLVEQRLWNGEPRRNRLLLRKAGDWPESSDGGVWADKEKIRTYVDDQRRQLVAQRRWSFITALVTTVSATCVVWWLLGDIKPAVHHPVLSTLLSWVDPPKVPLVDKLHRGVDGSGVADEINDPHHWPARVVALSYALLAAKIYHSLYARISPLRARRTPGFGPSAVLATVWIRGMPLLNAGLVLWVTLVSASYWPLAVIVGQVLAAFGNVAVLSFVLRAFGEARGQHDRAATTPPISTPPISTPPISTPPISTPPISTPPISTPPISIPPISIPPISTAPISTVPSTDTEVTGLDLVASWVPSAWFYAVLCAVVGVLIFLGLLKDAWLYASIVAFLNLGLLYAVKCGRNGPKMRVALHRATFAAERVGLGK